MRIGTATPVYHQREQCLAAAGRAASARDRQHLLLAQIGLLSRIGLVREGAVMTDVPAKLGQRNEDFAGEGDRRFVTGVAQRRGRLR